MLHDFDTTTFARFERRLFIAWSRFIDMFAERIVVTVAVVA